MKPFIIETYLILCVFALTSCSVKDYYFELSALENTKIYKYECKLDSTKTQYWKLTSAINNQSLTTEAYGSDFIKYELFKEKYTDKGSQVEEFTSFSKNKEGVMISKNKKLLDVDVFRWETQFAYTYSAESTLNNHTKTIFSKKRSYVGTSKINILGKQHQAIKLKGIYKTIITNSTQKYQYTQFSYYIKGIGLAKMEKHFEDGSIETLELTEIISNKQWELLKNATGPDLINNKTSN